ncbi:MAG: hypothetical protein WBE20_13055, partial [Candidatus Acidiferrales bacterium]
MNLRLKKTITALRKAGAFGAALALAALIFGARARAQSGDAAQGQMLGQVIGNDISVMGPSSVVPETAAGEQSRTIAFAGGSTIVVHSGKARVDFIGGGEIDVCGPAKFTVLDSGEALTIALSFGRVHVKIDALRPITIYTPTILATPISIQEQPREMTVGIANTGAMCVVAARGAVQVQQQLSGETLVVPQPSEVLLQGAPFGAVAAAAGSCGCNFEEPVAQQRAATPAAVTQSHPSTA